MATRSMDLGIDGLNTRSALDGAGKAGPLGGAHGLSLNGQGSMLGAQATQGAFSLGGGRVTVEGNQGPIKAGGGDGPMTMDFSNVELGTNGTHWTLTDGVDTIELTGATAVTIDGTTYRLVDHFGSGTGGYQSIAAGIAAANPGEVVIMAEGTYAENVVVNKSVTLEGVGDAGDVVIEGTFHETNGISSGTTVGDYLQTAGSYSGSPGNGVTISANGVTLRNITIDDFLTGVELGSNDGATLEDVIISNMVQAVRKGTAAVVTNFTMLGGEINDSYHGVIINAAADGSGEFSGVLIDGTSFSHLTEKGIYVEQLSDAEIMNIVMSDVGNWGRGPAFGGTQGEFGAGIDINLKYEAYSAIDIHDFLFTNVGYSNKDGGAANGLFGGAITVKARDDAPSYNTFPASLDGITIHDGSIDGTSTGIRYGEPGKLNAGALNDLISNVNILNADNGGYDNRTLQTQDVTLSDDADVAVVNPLATGNITFDAGDGADQIYGGGTGVITMNGGAGNDLLVSGGSDVLAGGDDDDTYVLAGGDTVTENFDEGTDTVIADFDYTLGANVENLTLIDAADDIQIFDDMALGAITDGENGWTVLAGGRDQEVVDRGGGNYAFRMSSDPGVPDFAGPYSPEVSVAAGETASGTGVSSQLVEYDFQAVSTALGDLSRLEIDFGNSDGTDRNNFLVIENTDDGIRIAVAEPDVLGDFGDAGTFPDDWRELASGIDNSVEHQLSMRLTYVDGANNDVIQVYLDGQLIGTTTTFENYRDALGGTHDGNLYTTDRVFFRPSANGAPNDGPGGANQGFYIDDLHVATYNNLEGTGNELNNVITGNSGDNLLSGMDGDDTINGGVGNDTGYGGAGVDTMSGEDGDDAMAGGGDNDVLNGNAGDDILDGGDGDDTLDGGDGSNAAGYLSALSAVKVKLEVVGAQDTLGAGNDTLTNISNVIGSNFDDLLFGNADDNMLAGMGGKDRFQGKDGADTMFGGAGNDRLTGGNGDDVIVGGAGNDKMKGQADNDTFAFADGFGNDTIKGFDADDDTLLFDSGIAGDIHIIVVGSTGTLVYTDAGDSVLLKNVFDDVSGNIVIGTAPAEPADYLI